jgi:molybdenum cofactor guanylyltransferase
MGRNKALLPFRGGALAGFVARAAASAAGSVVLVGDPILYGELGYPVVPDLYPGEGPLGGILTALHHTSADWNLVVACDMPGISAEFLAALLDAAERVGCDALVPTGPSGRPEPLCAVYHRRAYAPFQQVFGAGERRVTAAFASVRAEILPVKELAPFQNVNTPEDWARYAAE